MNIIKLKVNNFEIIPEEKSYVIENQVNEFALEFEFDDSWNYETKYVIFDNEETTYKRPIINNQVIIPSELLNGRTTIQIYAQDVENNEIVKRKPSFKYSFSILNSLSPEGVEETDLPTPSQWEIYISQIEEMCNDLQDQFDDLKEECESKCDDVIERLEQDEQDIQTNTDNIRTNAEAIDKLNTDLLDYSLITETGNKISMSINPQTYVITLSLKDKNDNILSTQSVDLPLETMIVSASYSNGILTFTLKNGQTLQVPISDLIDGLVSTDTFNQAVQGLSNRITTIENDYLKASDKTELQKQLTQNADIESLQQENERLSRIVSGLPTKNASGTNFVLNDMVNCEIKEISLKGNTLQDGTPTPDTPVEIQSVKGNQTIQFCGKNLLNLYDKTDSQNGVSISIKNGEITLNGTATSNFQWKNLGVFKHISGLPYQLIFIYESGSCTNYQSGLYLSDDPNTTQNVGGGIALLQSNRNANVNDSGTKNYYLYSSINSGCSFSNYKVKVQIVLGETADYNFEQFKQVSEFPISLGTIELNKIGDYQDKIYKSNDKWYLEKNVESVVLNSSMNPSIDTSSTNTMRLRYVGIFENNIKFTVLNISNILTWNSSIWINDIVAFYVDSNSKNLIARLPKTLVGTTQQTLNQWLDNNVAKFTCILSTPVITEITDDNLINQLEALNNYILLTNNTIISNGNLPVINDITGYVDIMSLISTQDNRNVVEEKKIVTKPVEETIDEPIEEPVETKEEER